MKTIIAKADNENDIDVLNKAAETVYGLGGDGLDPAAAKKIYAAKGRPSDNPLILHISHISQLRPLVREIPVSAEKLIKEFWPGPLTLIFKKADIVPYETTGGLDTVAVRFPENRIAQRFITLCGRPIAAPSANSSGRPSPTRASHVEFDLSGKIDMIIDGGHCEFGLESTIVDVSEDKPCLLRPGSVTVEMLEEVLGPIDIDKAVTAKPEAGERPKAPGMKYTHYSPAAKVIIVRGNEENMIKRINELISHTDKSLKTGVIASEETKDRYIADEVLVTGSRENTAQIASNLFKMLRKCDHHNIDVVFAEGLSENELGMAIMNRLKKAAGYEIYDV